MIGKAIISSVLAVSTLMVVAAAVGEEPDEHEKEAYAQVDMLLSTCDWSENIRSDGSGYSVEKKVELLRQTLQDIARATPDTESSNAAQVRGYTIELTKRLLSLHDLIKAKDDSSFKAASEPVGLRIHDMVKSGQRLPYLEDLLVALVSAREDRAEGDNSEKGRGFWCKLWHKICD